MNSLAKPVLDKRIDEHFVVVGGDVGVKVTEQHKPGQYGERNEEGTQAEIA